MSREIAGIEEAPLRPTDSGYSRDFLEHGLAEADAAKRRALFGPNTLPQQPRRSAWAILAGQLANFIVLLLLAAAGTAAVLGETTQSLAILAALAINAGVGFAMDYRAETVIASLQALAIPIARVRRGGRELELAAGELVPGDVVLLEAGDRVPADADVAQGDCRVDESLLSGESVPSPKRPAPGVGSGEGQVYAGTVLTRGSAVAVVTRTGSQTELGRIGRMLGETRRPRSPIDERLAALGGFLLWSILALSAIVIGLGLWQGRPPGILFETAIALAVAAVPEGLPSVATLAMAAGVRRLGRFGLRVRHLPALEALGSITTLCLDKTGTLTLNAMTVERVAVPGRDITVTGEGWGPDGALFEDGGRVDPEGDPTLIALIRAGQACNDATWECDESGWHVHGDPSEGAFLVLAAKAGQPDPRRAMPVHLALQPGPERPWMLVVRTDEAGRQTAFVKGAPEQVLARCVTEASSRADRPLRPSEHESWLERSGDLARQGLRVFGLADRAVRPDEAEPDVIGAWRFLGLVAMRDPPRPDAREMLQAAHRAGIRTIMITGDHPATAEAIARDLDLSGGRPPRVSTGSEIDADFGAESGADLDVYARATPEGKFRLVQSLQARGEIVAMTGDGVNDAPALRAAVVGVAMGRGTDVARDAASVVLVDESLATLLAGIREGRGSFLNIQKSVDYLLTCSMATMLVVLIASAVGLPLPLHPLQILYLNLLMHTFPALGLALEPTSKAVLDRPPPERGAWLLGPTRLFLILWHGLIITVATLAVTAWGTHHESEGHGRTLAFTTLAFSLLLHTLADRAPEPFLGWRWRRGSSLPAFLAVALALLLAAIYAPGLNVLLDMTRLDPADWLTVLVAAVSAAVAVEVSKGRAKVAQGTKRPENRS